MDAEATRIVGVAVPRDELVARLDARVEHDVGGGLLDEVASPAAAGPRSGRDRAPRHRIRAGAAQLAGDVTEAEAIAQTQSLTRRYARRQVSWFKRYAAITWVDSPADAAALADSLG